MFVPTCPPLRRSLRRCCALTLVFAAAGLQTAHADRRVAVKATADENYVAASVDENGNRKIQKYVFLEGTFQSGSIRDRSVENAEIQEIARTLAPYLARKNFLPTNSTEEADIVIAIHWGTTVSLSHNKEYVSELMQQARDRQHEAKEYFNSTYIGEDGEVAEPTDYAQGLLQESAAAAESPDYEWARLASTRSEREFKNQPTATLLGFGDILNRDASRAFSTEEARTVNAMLEEDRYFIVLAAYDIKNQKEGGAPQRLWVARLSTRAAGTDFTRAVEQLGEVGSHYFGENVPELAVERVPAKSQRADVEIGDPVVVEDPVK